MLKVAEQIEGFVKSNIFPVAEIVKPEFVNQYIINITYTSNISYTSNIYSPIVDYSIILTEITLPITL